MGGQKLLKKNQRHWVLNSLHYQENGKETENCFWETKPNFIVIQKKLQYTVSVLLMLLLQ